MAYSTSIVYALDTENEMMPFPSVGRNTIITIQISNSRYLYTGYLRLKTQILLIFLKQTSLSLN